MRLARYHQATKENQLFQRLVRTLLQTAHNGNGLSLSDLAFYALAVKAACGNPNNVSSEGHSINLIHQLNHDLQEKMKRFNTVSFDNTETYEYILNTFDEETSKLLLNISLAFLALCLEERVIPSDSVEWFVNEILYYQYPYRKYISFETNSYSILALTCLYHSITLYSQLRTKLFVAMQFSVEGLLRRLRSDGSFGGIVNTTLAIQAMGADILVHPLRYSCRKSLQYLINQTHTWNRTAMSSEALALIIEVLEGKTYLDISGIICDTNGQTSANTVPSSTLSSAPPAGTSLSTHHNMGTARASVDPPYRSTGGTRPFFGTVHRNTGLTHPTMEIRPPDTDTTRRVLSATGHRWGTIHPPLTLNVGHQTVAEPLSIRLHTATITTAQPRVSPGADTCCIPEEQRPLENLLVSILLETVGSCKDGPDPRVLIALRLSNRHNQSKEQTLQDCLLKSYSEKTVGDGNFTTGDIGLYTLAFRASCINPANIPNDNLGINLIRLLDTTLAIEMHALAKTKSYFTNSYQVSLAVLALCLENEEIAINIAHDFVSFIINFEAPEAKNMTTGAKCSYILALSCLLNSQGHLKSIHSRIQVAIQLLLSDLLQGLRANGSFGSVLDTGLVLQVLNAKLGPRIPLARDIYNCSQSLQTMLQTIINQMPPDTLDVVATLPALEGRSYLDIKQLCGSGESHCSEPGPLSLKILNGTQG